MRNLVVLGGMSCFTTPSPHVGVALDQGTGGLWQEGCVLLEGNEELFQWDASGQNLRITPARCETRSR